MAALYWEILFFLCGLIHMLGAEQFLNPDDIMFDIQKVYKCENFEEVVKFNTNFHDYKLDVEFELEEEFTDIFQATVYIDKFVDEEWVRKTNTSGKACELLDHYVKTAWQQLRENVEPALTGDCAIEPGKHKLSNFGVSRDVISFRAAEIGLFRIQVTVSDEFDTELACFMADVELYTK